MCDRRLLTPALLYSALSHLRVVRWSRINPTNRPPSYPPRDRAAPLSFITRRRIRPVPSALPLRRGQGEVSIRFWSGGYRRVRNLEVIDFTDFDSLSAEDGARKQILPLKGEAAVRPEGEDRNDSAAPPPPSPAATPPPLGGGLVCPGPLSLAQSCPGALKRGGEAGSERRCGCRGGS